MTDVDFKPFASGEHPAGEALDSPRTDSLFQGKQHGKSTQSHSGRVAAEFLSDGTQTFNAFACRFKSETQFGLRRNVKPGICPLAQAASRMRRLTRSRSGLLRCEISLHRIERSGVSRPSATGHPGTPDQHFHRCLDENQRAIKHLRLGSQFQPMSLLPANLRTPSCRCW